jgi:nitrate/nitrite transporter NarK
VAPVRCWRCICAALLIGAAGFNVGGSSVALVLFILAMLCLGAGNGAVFQLVPQRFGKEIGVMTGLVGMAGGVGGLRWLPAWGPSSRLPVAMPLACGCLPACAAWPG